MLQVTFNDADRILLDMADEAEAAPLYNQESFGHKGGWGNDCGSPGCMIGTYAMNHPGSLMARYTDSLACFQWPTLEAEVYRELQLTEDEFMSIFSCYGCNDAGTDGKKAAAFVREFVRKRALARIST